MFQRTYSQVENKVIHRVNITWDNATDRLVSLGVEWFQYFWDGFPTYVKENHLDWNKALDYPDKKWSKMMFDFLGGLAEAMNYHVEKEVRTIKARRFDMTWTSSESPRKTIVIEHENQLIDRAITEEIPKLANVRADLCVCITYTREKDYPSSQFAEQTKAILEEANFKDEFLLILGSYTLQSPTDWICFRFNQRLAVEKLVLPSPIMLVPFKGSGEAEEEVEDWMINRLKVWKRIQDKGGSVTREQLHEIAKDVGMDNRGLGGFFVGKHRSLYWKQDEAHLSDRAIELVKKLGKKVD